MKNNLLKSNQMKYTHIHRMGSYPSQYFVLLYLSLLHHKSSYKHCCNKCHLNFYKALNHKSVHNSYRPYLLFLPGPQPVFGNTKLIGHEDSLEVSLLLKWFGLLYAEHTPDLLLFSAYLQLFMKLVLSSLKQLPGTFESFHFTLNNVFLLLQKGLHQFRGRCM